MSASLAGLRLQCDMPVMFASLSHLEGVLVRQAAGVIGRGGCLAEGELVVGGLKMHMHPISSARERYQEWDDCSGGSMEQGRKLHVCVCVCYWSGKIQFLQLYCSVCHHSLSRLNTRAE